MIIANKENSIFDYEGEQNVIVLPITNYVRKDGNLVVKNELTKQFFEKYSNLSKKWGYMISQGVEYPSYSTSTTQLLGISDRKHYASSFDEEKLISGLWYIKEQALLNPNLVFYIEEQQEIDKNILQEIFEFSDNIVMLRKEHENE